MSAKFRRLTGLEARIDYSFADKDLGLLALRHSSYGNGRVKTFHNERLEFLGDRILGLMTAEYLYRHTTDDEGGMAPRLNALVRKETCARVSRSFGLGEALEMSPSEEKQGGRDKTSILGDACEALLAAIYLDGGFEAAQAFYDKHWSGEVEAILSRSAKDPKTSLQEKATAANYSAPIYDVVKRSGPDHRPLFVIEVSVEGFGSAQGTGKSKKDAERFAALHLLEKWPE